MFFYSILLLAETLKFFEYLLKVFSSFLMVNTLSKILQKAWKVIIILYFVSEIKQTESN